MNKKMSNAITYDVAESKDDIALEESALSKVKVRAVRSVSEVFLANVIASLATFIVLLPIYLKTFQPVHVQYLPYQDDLFISCIICL